jgi:hypothetical protein
MNLFRNQDNLPGEIWFNLPKSSGSVFVKQDMPDKMPHQKIEDNHSFL